ncbi:PIN domain nuclease [Candidatus Marsarchaeota G1 archaeon OSP_D]|jgi:Predicted nucleic acid-binding protein, contains PIN domain|uniref:PIN domain nuclease n=3 Tax=Candidatus Marsarchaeota group 1 TaxID=2203770 RepID=A0A2R6AHF4_9ARCH|nr:MAG: PIN domain nuclease [Candidatus Marsarchaeota G1 archaeon OSP_D]PSN85778.1 MAG: PIN domain nuclease [Candidatus Marsarchaeota G1 archaeon BE_D]PSN89055.1 MAG: PIN domain nuclease [Candidatus Marsarchaeota G1 archaeon OSP_C]
MFLDANFLIYLNLGEPNVESLFERLLEKQPFYTDVLVLEETFYISKKKYGVKYEDSADFVKEVILPCSRVLKIGIEDFNVSLQFLDKLKPSDALHVAVMKNNGISTIISEDEGFDKIKHIKRVWI